MSQSLLFGPREGSLLRKPALATLALIATVFVSPTLAACDSVHLAPDKSALGALPPQTSVLLDSTYRSKGSESWDVRLLLLSSPETQLAAKVSVQLAANGWRHAHEGGFIRDSSCAVVYTLAAMEKELSSAPATPKMRALGSELSIRASSLPPDEIAAVTLSEC